MHHTATVNVSHNVVYKIMKQVNNFEEHATPVCPLQVYSYTYMFNNHFSENSWYMDVSDCMLVLSNNMEMISKILPTDIT